MQHNYNEVFVSLFKQADRTFEIPAYQRAYSWGEEEVKQFLTDLQEAQGTYYLGHYLFEKHETNGSLLYVIDGQQRLTTCVIFFSALYQELKTRAAAGETVSINPDDLRDTYLQDPEHQTQKLKTVTGDDNFFREEIILHDGTHYQETDTSSKKRIRFAYESFKEFLNKSSHSTKELGKWGNLIAEASVTHLIVDSKIKAAQIFAFQNDRGKKLTDLEILKSYFMLQILLSGQSQYIINDNIRRIESEFSRIYTKMELVDLDESDVLAYFWRSTTNNPYAGEPVVEDVKKRVNSKSATERVRWIEKFAAGLAQAFDFVREIEHETYELAKDLRDLNQMALAYPILLRAYRDGIDQQTKKRLFRFLENIVFRYKLRGGRADIYTRLNYHFFNQETALTTEVLNAKIDQFIAMLKQRDGWGWYWNDHNLQEYLNADFYENPVDNYLLWKYERYISSKDYPIPPLLSYRDLIKKESIEHIAPQNPEHGDPLQDGYGFYEHPTVAEQGIRSGNWLHKLGNLMLMAQGQNSRIKNRHFEIKMADVEADGLLKQQQQLAKFLATTDTPVPGTKIKVWDQAAIKQRQKFIVQAALDIWNLEKI